MNKLTATLNDEKDSYKAKEQNVGLQFSQYRNEINYEIKLKQVVQDNVQQ